MKKGSNLLDKIKYPKDLRKLSDKQLKIVCKELEMKSLMQFPLRRASWAGLGVVELTVAIHSVFNTPNDKLIWDVGHQCYPHKVITGRRDKIRTIRQPGGLYGLLKDQRVNLTHSALHIRQHQFLLVWEWLLPET